MSQLVRFRCNILQLMEKAGFKTIPKLAKAAGIERTLLSHIANGRSSLWETRGTPEERAAKIDARLKGLSNALGVSIDDLVCDELQTYLVFEHREKATPDIRVVIRETASRRRIGNLERKVSAFMMQDVIKSLPHIQMPFGVIHRLVESIVEAMELAEITSITPEQTKMLVDAALPLILKQPRVRKAKVKSQPPSAEALIR